MDKPVLHEFSEEVFVVEGDFVVGCDATGPAASASVIHLRLPPAGCGARPVHQRGGCVLLEFQFFEARV